ncbi:hypothetical protein [Phenylobacterium sp.]
MGLPPMSAADLLLHIADARSEAELGDRLAELTATGDRRSDDAEDEPSE